jgi:hypothetical protein
MIKKHLYLSFPLQKLEVGLQKFMSYGKVISLKEPECSQQEEKWPDSQKHPPWRIN